VGCYWKEAATGRPTAAAEKALAVCYIVATRKKKSFLSKHLSVMMSGKSLLFFEHLFLGISAFASYQFALVICVVSLTVTV
jgi:hypothetical protein